MVLKRELGVRMQDCDRFMRDDIVYTVKCME